MKPESLYERFLDRVPARELCTIFLTNGVKLSGNVARKDTECLILQRDGTSQLVMRSAIATIMPLDGFVMGDI